MASVKEIDENTIQVTVSMGYDIYGKKRRKKQTFKLDPYMTKKQKEKAKEKIVYEFEQQVLNGDYLQGDTKLVDFSKKFMEDYAKENLSPTTYERYKTLLKRINLELGTYKLKDIRPAHIRDFLKKLEKTTKKVEIKDDEGNVVEIKEVPIAPKTRLHYFRLLSSIMHKAVVWDYIKENVCNRVEAPRLEKKEAPFVDVDTIKTILKLLESEPIEKRAIITLTIYTGLRRGELCGLCWSDGIDFENKMLKVVRSSQYISDKGIIDKEPKTESGKREICLSEGAIKVLKQWQKAQLEQRLKIGDQWKNTDKVFTTWDGSTLHPDTASKWFSKFVKKHKDILPQDITLHSLRHANISLQIYAGIDPKTVSVRAGHSNVGITMNIYTHMQKSANQLASEKLDELLS